MVGDERIFIDDDGKEILRLVQEQNNVKIYLVFGLDLKDFEDGKVKLESYDKTIADI